MVVAAVRWFHMCRPFDRNPRYYYPGRPYLTASWLSSLSLLPYVLHPEGFDAWCLARFYFLPVTLYHFSILMFSYFGSVMGWKKWRWPIFIVGTPVVLSLLAGVGIAVCPGEQMAGTAFPVFVLFVLGGLVTAVCIVSLAFVLTCARQFDPDDFSNPADFPVTQARRWTSIILLNLAFCWTGALLDSPVVLALIQILIAISAVLFVITVLHPNRYRPLEDPQEEETASYVGDTPSGSRSLSIRNQEEILAAIRTVVEQQQAFLDAHLTLQDVAVRSGYGRTYVSAVIKSELGGFVNYVNGHRLAYVSQYLAQHPDATIAEAIDAAGFGSRPTYYKFRRLQKEK